MREMHIRPGGTKGLHLAYAAGSFASDDDSFVVNQLGGESPFGATLASLGSDYAVHIAPDGAGRTVYAGLDITTPLGSGKGSYLRDSESGETWSPFFGPACEKADEHSIAFLPGQVTAHTLQHKIATSFTIATLPGKPVEVWLVRMANMSAEERKLTFTTYIEPCIGPGLESVYKENEKTLLMRRTLSATDTSLGQDMVLFHSSTLAPTRFQTEKSEFIGGGRTLRNPRELDGDQPSGADGPASRSIASFTVEIELPIEGEAEFAFCFGVARSPEHALELARGLSKTELASDAAEASRAQWRDLTSTTRVITPDAAFNALMNTWLPYDAYSGWIGRRTGGVCLDPTSASDVLRRLYALSATAPEMCRGGLLSFAAGIATSGAFSPDSESIMMLPAGEMLWLAACTARYVAETGDTSVLTERVDRGDGPGLTLKEHCERAMRVCDDAQGVSEALLETTRELWDLMGDATEAPDARRSGGRPEYPEQRILPRRVKYLESVCAAMASQSGHEELERAFPASDGSEGDSCVACCAYVAGEQILGVQATSAGLTIEPNLPENWAECEMTRKLRGDTYKIRFTKSPTSTGQGVSIVVDGDPMLGPMVPYFGDGQEHTVDVLVS